MICFQNVSLIYYRTTLIYFRFSKTCCDLLSKCIFDLLPNNTWQIMLILEIVVICFQNVSLIYYRTTDRSKNTAKSRVFSLFWNKKNAFGNLKSPVNDRIFLFLPESGKIRKVPVVAERLVIFLVRYHDKFPFDQIVCP